MSTDRQRLPHHFTASGIVVCGDHVLLVDHKRIGAWVPPGGHIDEDELPEETVVRELLEETGVSVTVHSEEVPETGDADAFFLATPLYVQSVLAIERGERFYHIDLAYLCTPDQNNQLDDAGLPILKSNSEVKSARWVQRKQASQLTLAKNVAEALQRLDNGEVMARFRPQERLPRPLPRGDWQTNT